MSDPEKVADPAFRQRIRQGAEKVGVSLDLTQLERLERYFQVLRRWNRKINLTALPLESFPDRSLNRIFIEPLQAAQFVEDTPLIWFDFGSGGGSPAIPLKVVRPRLRLTLVESRSKKAAFLMEVVRSLELTETDVLSVRIEELDIAGRSGHVDLLTLRALRVDETLLRAAATLLRPHGRLLLFGSKPSGEHNVDFQLVDQLELVDGRSALHVLRRVKGGAEGGP